ncbi:hypothetical protein PFISCL1PPCAC_16584, partial [Pristionchus fissidentatus]
DSSMSTSVMKHSPQLSSYGDAGMAAAQRFMANATNSSLLIANRPTRISFLSSTASFLTACLGPQPSLLMHGPATPEDDESFRQLAHAKLPADPNDLVALGVNQPYFVVPLTDGSVHVVMVDEGQRGIQPFHRIATHEGGAEASCVCAVDNSIIVGGSDGKIVMIDAVQNETRVVAKSGAGIECISTLGGGSVVATGNMAGLINLWDLRTAQSTITPQFSVSPKIFGDSCTAIATHPAQTNILAAGYESGSISFIDARGSSRDQPPEMKNTFELASGPITKIAFHPVLADNLFVSSVDGSLVHWDAAAQSQAGLSSNTLVRLSPWLAPTLESSSQFNALLADYPSSVNSFALRDDAIVIACDNQQIRHTVGMTLV